MKRYLSTVFATAIVVLLISCSPTDNNTSNNNVNNSNEQPKQHTILPTPDTVGEKTLEYSLYSRRSVREFSDNSLTVTEVSQLLWSMQGITNQIGFRTAPSAGALFPLEVYIVTKNVDGLQSGIYKYHADEHTLEKIKLGNYNQALYSAALNQDSVKQAPINFVITAVFERITSTYGERGENYVYIEAGHSCQNLLLQAVALNMGAVPIGAFTDSQISQLLSLDDDETPVYVIPVGKLN